MSRKLLNGEASVTLVEDTCALGILEVVFPRSNEVVSLYNHIAPPVLSLFKLFDPR